MSDSAGSTPAQPTTPPAPFAVTAVNVVLTDSGGRWSDVTARLDRAGGAVLTASVSDGRSLVQFTLQGSRAAVTRAVEDLRGALGDLGEEGGRA
jgi:hypothetical protein